MRQFISSFFLGAMALLPACRTVNIPTDPDAAPDVTAPPVDVTTPPRDVVTPPRDGPSATDVVTPPRDVVTNVPADTVRYTGTFGARSGTYTLNVGGMNRTVVVHVPPRTGSLPLVVAFHGTNGAAQEFVDELRINEVADQQGFVVMALQGEDLQGEPRNADHRSRDLYARMWDIVDRNPDTNRDLLFTRGAIQEARRAINIDPRRVYLLGHSNGGFFAFHAAATISSRVAGFASSSSGVIRCGYRADCAFAAGRGTTCAALATEAGWCAQTCAASSSLMAPLPTGRVPRAFLAHGNRDDIVSVAFTCALAREMGSRAVVEIVAGGDHVIPAGFARNAWTRLSPYTVDN